MFYNAKNGVVALNSGEMEYVRFGSGPEVLIMLPGLGDGLRSVKGTALPVAVMYRKFAKDYTVYMFSRRKVLSEGASTCDMASDIAEAMKILGISRAHMFGVSMGGMIAQHFAADYPDIVDKLVLVVTCARANPVIQEAVGEWISCVSEDDHVALMESNLRRIYSEEYYRKNKWMIPVLGKLTKPASYDRFLIMARACLDHNAYDKLAGISAPTLVIGGEKDLCLSGDASREIAGAIEGAQLYMYEQWGHGLYEEAKDFNEKVLSFLK